MKLHHAIDGPEDAPVIVFASSLGATHAMWDQQVAALADQHRVVRYDHRGHGASPVPPGPYTVAELADDLLELLDDLGIEAATLVGLSLGGAVAMTAALAAPERFERLVLCCTAMKFGEPETWHERAAAVRAEGMPAVVESVLERWFRPSIPPVVRERFEAMLLATPPEGYAACCEALAGHDLRGRLGAISLPTLVVAGDEDPSTPPELLAAIAAEIPGSVMRVFGSRHIVNATVPAPFSQTLRSFVRGGDGMRTRRAVLGDAHVDASIERTTGFTAAFQDLITRYAWGEIWTRPGLDRRMRSAITLTALVAGGHENELALHVRAARRNGLTPDEIKEILLQTAIYCGVPAANSAFAIAQRVIDEESPS